MGLPQVFYMAYQKFTRLDAPSGKTDYHCKIKETLFIHELQPALNANVSSEKLLLY